MNTDMSAGKAPVPVLEIRGLRIEGKGGVGWSEIVKGVSLSLRQGEVMGLIGESGAGKSTIGLAALGYARAGCRFSGGEVRFCGDDLLCKPAEALRRLRGVRIAYIAQSAAAFFNPAHRLIDQFIEVLTTHGVMNRNAARARAAELYSRLELPDPMNFGQRYPHQVSGGQLQRAMIAMAMACDPDLIVFDEPTTALDVTTQVGVLAAVKKAVSGSKSAALYITHDLAVVAQLADRIMVLRNGACVEEGATAQVLENPAQDYTKSLLAANAISVQEQPRQNVILDVKRVTAFHGAHRVLGDVSFSASRGSTVAIVGESGSGKSTLARVIAGLMPSARGQVIFDGEDLPLALSRRARRTLQRLQMIYQTPDTALNPKQRVSEILGRPLAFYNDLAGPENASRVRGLLDLVELKPEIFDRFPGELSGGQKQRICIARALASNPDLIICDEVTSGLDPLVAKGVLSLLSRLQAEMGTTYLFITHDLKIVEAIADDVIVMSRGRIVDQGRKCDVMSPPFDPYTEKLLASVPQMDSGWLDNLLLAR